MAKLKYVWNSNVGKGMLPRSDPKVCREEEEREEEEEEAPPRSREQGAQRHDGAPWRQMVELRVREIGGSWGVERPFKWELNVFKAKGWKVNLWKDDGSGGSWASRFWEPAELFVNLCLWGFIIKSQRQALFQNSSSVLHPGAHNRHSVKLNEVLNVTLAKTVTSHFAPCALIFLFFNS